MALVCGKKMDMRIANCNKALGLLDLTSISLNPIGSLGVVVTLGLQRLSNLSYTRQQRPRLAAWHLSVSEKQHAGA